MKSPELLSIIQSLVQLDYILLFSIISAETLYRLELLLKPSKRHDFVLVSSWYNYYQYRFLYLDQAFTIIMEYMHLLQKDMESGDKIATAIKHYRTSPNSTIVIEAVDQAFQEDWKPISKKNKEKKAFIKRLIQIALDNRLCMLNLSLTKISILRLLYFNLQHYLSHWIEWNQWDAIVEMVRSGWSHLWNCVLVLCLHSHCTCISWKDYSSWHTQIYPTGLQMRESNLNDRNTWMITSSNANATSCRRKNRRVGPYVLWME